MLSLKLTLARTASQITKDTIHPAQIIFSIDIFQTWIIPLHAHLQVIFTMYNCVKIHQYRFICLGGVDITRNMNRQIDWVIPIYPQKCFCRGYNSIG